MKQSLFINIVIFLAVNFIEGCGNKASNAVDKSNLNSKSAITLNNQTASDDRVNIKNCDDRNKSDIECKFELPKPPPKVLNILIDGVAPRSCLSQIISISIEMDSVVTLLPGAVSLIRKHDGGMITPTLSALVTAGKSKLTLSLPNQALAPGLVQGNSLASGNWKLFIDSTKVYNSNTEMDRDFILELSHLYGDINLNCAVDTNDMIAFRLAFGTCGNNLPFDQDASGCVDLNDFLVMRNQFGTSLDYITFISPFSVPPSPLPIEKNAPIANFTASSLTGSAPLTVRFSDTSEGQPNHWNWQFGHSSKSVSNIKNPSYIFTSNGDYYVTLVAANSSGQTNKTIEIHVGDPLPPLNVNFGTVGSSEWHNYLKLSFVDLSQGATHWNWNFGDGTYSTLRSPNHIYSTQGTYTVSLSVSNYLGNQTEVKHDYVTIGTLENFQMKTEDELISQVQGNRSSTPDVQLYSVYEPQNLKYIRNQNSWTHSLDMSSLAVWNSSTGGPHKGGTVITPLHIATANHWIINIGNTIHFIDTNGQIVVRTVVGAHQIGNTDANIQTLDSPLPPSVHPAYMVSNETLAMKYSSAKELPLRAFHTDQSARAIPYDIIDTGTATSLMLMLPSSIPFLNAMYKPVIGGDSGSPTYLIYNGKLILATLFYGASSGPSYFGLYSQINDFVNQEGQTLNTLAPQDFSVLPNW